MQTRKCLVFSRKGIYHQTTICTTPTVMQTIIKHKTKVIFTILNAIKLALLYAPNVQLSLYARAGARIRLFHCYVLATKIQTIDCILFLNSVNGSRQLIFIRFLFLAINLAQKSTLAFYSFVFFFFSIFLCFPFILFCFSLLDLSVRVSCIVRAIKIMELANKFPLAEVSELFFFFHFFDWRNKLRALPWDRRKQRHRFLLLFGAFSVLCLLIVINNERTNAKREYVRDLYNVYSFVFGSFISLAQKWRENGEERNSFFPSAESSAVRAQSANVRTLCTSAISSRH